MNEDFNLVLKRTKFSPKQRQLGSYLSNRRITLSRHMIVSAECEYTISSDWPVSPEPSEYIPARPLRPKTIQLFLPIIIGDLVLLDFAVLLSVLILHTNAPSNARPEDPKVM
jgi:hypothetical protein